MFSALSPVIGARGVAALYQRSIHLAQQDYPCLKGADAGEPGPSQFEALRAILASQPEPRAARDASTALLRTFTDLLAGMIGAKLTQQLLEPTAPAQRITHAGGKAAGE